MKIHRPASRWLTLAAFAVFTACASTGNSAGDSTKTPEPPAPWSGARLSARDVPAVYRSEWTKAENRNHCALIAPATLGEGSSATPRPAPFSGGWAVAYDTPALRSAFGVAGTGASVSDATYRSWPHRVTWSDGSSAGYGPEGGTGPNQLAYVQIAGQSCLYNVWSRLGIAHLETLLAQLRFVDATAGAAR